MARSFVERMGFRMVMPQTVKRGEVSFQNFRMERDVVAESGKGRLAFECKYPSARHRRRLGHAAACVHGGNDLIVPGRSDHLRDRARQQRFRALLDRAFVVDGHDQFTWTDRRRALLRFMAAYRSQIALWARTVRRATMRSSCGFFCAANRYTIAVMPGAATDAGSARLPQRPGTTTIE